MSEIKELLVNTMEKIFKKHITKETVDLVDEGQWADDVWRILKENGLLAACISEKAGGAGGDLEDLFSLLKMGGKYAVPIPLMEYIFSNYILEKFHLAPTDEMITYNLSDTPDCTLSENGEVSGAFPHVAWGRYASNLVTIVKGSGGNYLVKVPLKDALVKEGANLAGEPRDYIKLTAIPVLEKSRIIDYEQLEEMILLETAAKCAVIAGTLEKIYESTIEYTKQRQQFGRYIHRFQLIQRHIAQLAGETVIVDSAVDNMMEALVEKRHRHEIPLTRIRIEEAIRTVSASAHQVHGAIGVTYEHHLHHYTRRLWSYRDEGRGHLKWSQKLSRDLLQSNNSMWEFITIY